MKKEVEVKYFLGANIDNILRIIEENKWEKIGETSQSDIYYTSKYKDFITSEECLRLRKTDNFVELTWKPPTTDEMTSKGQYWKEELDINVTSIEREIKKLLQVLDFIEYTTVIKKRVKYRIDENTMICLDNIQKLGWFIEIETISENEIESIWKNELYSSILNLKLENKIAIPYRDLIKSKILSNKD